RATSISPGGNLVHDLSETTAARMCDQMRAHQQPGDLIVASIHWGSNWGYGIPREKVMFAFFFSSRRRHTMLQGDWSSDVCSSDLFSPGFRWGISVLPGQAITLEDVYAHTALTYANTWTRQMTGAEVHRVMEDVADNLFHPDPYYRQGGDMVWVGGVTYAINPGKAMGRRITDVRV